MRKPRPLRGRTTLNMPIDVYWTGVDDEGVEILAVGWSAPTNADIREALGDYLIDEDLGQFDERANVEPDE